MKYIKKKLIGTSFFFFTFSLLFFPTQHSVSSSAEMIETATAMVYSRRGGVVQ